MCVCIYSKEEAFALAFFNNSPGEDPGEGGPVVVAAGDYQRNMRQFHFPIKI